MNKPVIDWQPCTVIGAYIRSHELHKGSVQILITYRTKTGRRFVKSVQCNNGRINKFINGSVIAWAYMPDPYDGDPETAEDND